MDNSRGRECHLEDGLFEIHNTLRQRASGGKIKGKISQEKKKKNKTREVKERTEPCAIKKKRSYMENFPMV